MCYCVFVSEVPQVGRRQKQSPDSVPRVWESPLLSELLLPGRAGGRGCRRLHSTHLLLRLRGRHLPEVRPERLRHPQPCYSRDKRIALLGDCEGPGPSHCPYGAYQLVLPQVPAPRCQPSSQLTALLLFGLPKCEAAPSRVSSPNPGKNSPPGAGGQATRALAAPAEDLALVLSVRVAAHSRL